MKTLFSHGKLALTLLAYSILLLTAVAPISAQPIITCPAGPVDVFVTELDQVSIDLPIANADSVTIANAGWQHDQLTFTATRQGLWQFTVIARSATDSTSCFVEVNVSFGQVPTADNSREEFGAIRYDRRELYLSTPRFVLVCAWTHPRWFEHSDAT